MADQWQEDQRLGRNQVNGTSIAGRRTCGAQPLRTMPEVEVFHYPETGLTDECAAVASQYAEVFGLELQDPHSGRSEPDLAMDPALPTMLNSAEVELLVAEATTRAEARGEARGWERSAAQARQEALSLFEADRARLYGQAAVLTCEFAAEREHYFHQVEHETVRLALAIAARVLRREAQMDPLLLTGAVRVALGQLSETTTVRLRVPAEDEVLWREALALMPALPLRPKIVADTRMGLGECRMETELGTTDLGLWAQLREIERGFFDRVGTGPVTARPAPNGKNEEERGAAALVGKGNEDGLEAMEPAE